MDGEIKYSKFDLTLYPLDIIILPSYKGSTLRGGFGNAFRKVVCTIKNKDCLDCLLKEKCIYSYVFETPPPSDTKIMRKYTNAPHPFIIEPPPERKRGYTPKDEITFGLTLIGKAVDYLPYFIYTFDELGRIGIGKGRGKYELKRVMSYESRVKSEEINPGRVIPAKHVLEGSNRGAGIQNNSIKTIYSSDTKTLKSFTPSILSFPPPITTFEGRLHWESSFDSAPLTRNPKPVILNFSTPTRILYNGHLTIDLEFHILIRNLLRRLSLLYYFHCGGDPLEWDFKGLIEKAKEVKVKDKNLKWYDWERYSARQDARLKMGGFVGEITFEGNIEPFMPLIRAGEVLHVGKGTGFGLGKYEVKKYFDMGDR